MSFETKQLAESLTFVVKTEEARIEKYALIIKVSPTLKDTKSPYSRLDMYGKFESGILATHKISYVSATINRTTLSIQILFRLESPNSDQVIEPFDVEFLSKNKLVKAFVHNFPSATLVPRKWEDGGYSEAHRNFNTTLNLQDDWTNDVDMIRVTFAIKIHKAPIVEKEIPNELKQEEKPAHFIFNMENPLVKFLQNGNLADVVICCEDVEFTAHRVILSVASTVFLAMFQTDAKEANKGRVEITDISKDIMKSILIWIYSGELPPAPDFESCVGIYKAAHKYCISSLQNWIITQISTLHINVDNVLEIYGLADTYGEEGLLVKVKGLLKSEKARIFKDREVYQQFQEAYPDFTYELFLQ